MISQRPEELPFPTAVSSSSVAAFNACEARWYWQYIRNQKPKMVSIHLHAGASFASGLEAARKAYYIEHKTQEEATAAGVTALIKAFGPYDTQPDQAKSWNRTAGALVAYLDEYQFGNDQLQPWNIEERPAVEFSFALPLPVAHPTTGDPILYTGRFDMVGEFDKGNLWCVDEKTTGQLGETWATKWDMRGQFFGYTWACRQHGINVQGVCTRGIAIRKTGYDFAQSFVLFGEGLVSRWHDQMVATVEDMVRVWKSGKYDQVFGDACKSFSGCGYQMLCKSPNPEAWLGTHYETFVYSSIRGVEDAN